ncbi:DUF5689 domain-containing protein [Chryseobacterium vrystaatense]|uniref:DUF5689 domain-containing protein n=1 Tax=Chryseobacterium vrystaatense TaxID=307480 RepID=A0A1M4VJK2_9FLAO|nr:DUF5689 domain-containing protein [Chryseobacterium vrystaatense]KFF28000.1 hypothetical protein IW16_01930 [Chryseobacterium vrystaatense]SHE69070.1 hypothetical protein SAMN02787073_0909 [Chryseobacterium vrystaatense]
MKNIYFKAVVFSAISMLALSSCVKSDDYDVPEIKCTNRFPAANHPLTDLATIAKPKPGEADIIKEDYIVEAYVGSSDESGNIYKMLFLQDKPENPTQGIEVDIDGGNQYLAFPTGSLVRINLKGLIVQASNGNIKIGSYDPNYSVGRINPNRIADYMARVCDGQKPVVAVMKPLEFNSIAEALKNGAHINQLVKIKNVQFEDAELTKNFADDAATGDRYITDKKAARLDLRFSNFATFAKSPISPKYAKSGDIVLLLSRYTSPSNPSATIFTEQAYIRNLDDLVFNGERFSPGVPENPSPSAINLFAGSDFENWTTFLSSVNGFGLKPYATQGVGLGFNGTNSLQIKGIPTANDYVFTSIAASGLPATPKRITFYIKGTSTGKSLSFNVYKTMGSTSAFYTFNLGTFSTGAVLDADSANANSYTGTINTNGQWRLVELNLTGLGELNLTAGKDMFAIKTGSNGNYDIQIDNIKIE